MKTVKIIIQTLLSLFLVLGIILGCVLFNVSAFFETDNMAATLDGINSGKKILEYEYLPEDGTEEDFYEALAKAIPLQVALVVDVSSDNAKTCQDGAFAYIREQNADKKAYLNFTPLASQLVKAYTDTAIDEGIINPDQYVTYTNVHYEKVRETKKNLLNETIDLKYKTELIRLDDEGFFCDLNIDGKNTFLYLLQTGNKAARTQNGLYQLLEERNDQLIDTSLLSYFDALKHDGTGQNTIAYDEYYGMIKEDIYTYIKDQGISLDDVDMEAVERKLEPGIKNHLYQKLQAALPNYEDTISSLPDFALSFIRRALNNSLTYIVLGVSALLVLLIVLSEKKTSLLFIGIAFFISGLCLYLAKTMSDKITLALGQSASSLSINYLLPDLIRAFLNRLPVYGIGLGVLGLILFCLSFLLNRKRQV